MSGFLDRAKEQAQRGLAQGRQKFDEVQAQGRQKFDEVQAQRAGNDLLRRLGSAYYAERRGSGSPEATQQALQALESHIATHGDGFLRS